MSKAKFSDKDIVHLAKLANLNLNSEEIKKYREQLSSIIEYVEQLNEVDTKNVDRESSISGLTNVWRNDEVQEERKIHPAKTLRLLTKTVRSILKCQE